MTVPLLISGRPLAVVNEDGSAIAGGGGGGGAPGYADATIPAPAYAPLVAFLDATGTVHVVTDTDPLPVVGGTGGGGGLTDVQLRATPVPVSGPLTDAQLRAADVPVGLNAASLAALETIQIGSLPAVALDVATLAALETISIANLPALLVGGRLDVNLGASGITLPVSGTFWQATQPVSLVTNTPDVTDRDARLLGRAKVLDTLGAVIDPALKSQLPAALVGARLDVNLGASGITLPVSGPLTDAQLRAVAVPVSGPLTDAQLRATAVPVSQAALTKGTQGANGVATQDLKDAGRNATIYHMALPILTTAAEVMMSLTGYKGGAAVAATATPAVVTAGKTFRITSITISYIATATAGLAKFTFRVNTAGVAVIGSPLVFAAVVGAGTPATAGSTQTLDVPLPEGWELPAAAGIAVGLQGLGVTMAGAIAGYGHCIITGFEY